MKLLYIASALLAIVGATDVDSIDSTNPTNKAGDIYEDNDGKLLLHARFSDNPKKGIIFSENDKNPLAKRKLDEQELIRRQSYHQRNAQNPDAVFNKPESNDDSDDDDSDDEEDEDDDDCEDDEDDDVQSDAPAAEMRQGPAELASTGAPAISNTDAPTATNTASATPTASMMASITPSMTASITPSMTASITPSMMASMTASIATVTATATPAMEEDDDDDYGYYGGAPNGGNCRCCCGGGGGPGFGYGPQMYPGYLMGGGMMMGGMMNPYLNIQQGGFPGGGPNGYYNQNGGQRMQGQGGFPGQGYQNGYSQMASQAPVLEITETIQSIGYQTILVTEDIPTGQEVPAYTSVPPSGGYPSWGNQNTGPQNNPVSYIYVPYTVTVTDKNGGNDQIGMPTNTMGVENNMPTNMPGAGGGPMPTNGADTEMDSQTTNIFAPPTIYLGTVSESDVQPFGEDATGSVQPFDEDDTGSVKPFGEGDTGSVKPFGEGDTGSVKPFGEGDTGSVKPFGEGDTGSVKPFGEDDTGSVKPFGGEESTKPTKAFGEDDAATDSGNSNSVLFIE
ncbi:hypothetical protein COEREDRAFT_84353 [Coemansia reversa NRRL 1564]|uniref:Uncharacterized protein n=1 Tax=Coemansia reversa (strain ATCC 12441 / NRRL 1564) TaxID=763665 RepID=A0A2G5BLA0_COERN|nr:hypothetical protein COEREDRAFT_84353 [Coemansia reversa NRRL 1564]|eukprot:PIA19742.1 hypothetical protein COEREDRAFT_84353 [Coemansia reversa NRRL 1564]